MYVEKAIFLLPQLLLLCESCRSTGVPGGTPEKRREAKVSLPMWYLPNGDSHLCTEIPDGENVVYLLWFPFTNGANRHCAGQPPVLLLCSG